MTKKLVNNMESQEVINAKVQKDVEFIKSSLSEIHDKLDNKYITREEFAPVKKISYGMAGAVLLGFISEIWILIKK